MIKEFWSALLSVVLIASQLSQFTQAPYSSLYFRSGIEVARRLTEMPIPGRSKGTSGRSTAPSVEPQIIAALASAGPVGKRYRPPQTPQPGPFQLPGQSFTLMPDGRWLVLGGNAIDGAVNAAWLLDPTQASAEKLPNGLMQPRAWHTATLLSDGTV